MKKLLICVSVVFTVLVMVTSPVVASVSASPQFSITYFDNFNYDTGAWETWDSGLTETKYWNDEYLADFASGNTIATDHYFTGISTFDLRGGLWSKDGHATGGEDWNPLQSVGDNVSGQSAHHVFAAEMTGWVHFNEGDILSLQSDDDAYIFLDNNTNWGDQILDHPGIHYFGNETLTITAALAGTHLMTVRFAERWDVHSGIAINLNDAPLVAIPAPGAILLGGIGLALVGWLRRRKTI